MPIFEIFTASFSRDYIKWITRWKSWPQREVSAHPDYVRLFKRPYDHACCAVLQDTDGGVLFPFILRPIEVEKWSKSKVWDIVSPYGYGGAFVWGSVDTAFFWEKFDEWAKHARIVSLFVRLSLFQGQILPFSGEVEIKSQNIIRTLDVDSETIWMDYAHKVRKNVKKARRNGLEVKLDLNGLYLKEFLQIYYSTMQYRGAADHYYFPEEFFQSIVRDLTGQFAFFHTVYDGEIVSTELVLVSVNYLYSFLGGTLPKAYPLRPNDLLKHAIVKWGKEQGKLAFVLGGGYRDDDGIFRYKQSFAPSGVVPFRVGKRIYDAQIYKKLIEQRSQWEKDQGNCWEPPSDFFPAYRS